MCSLPDKGQETKIYACDIKRNVCLDEVAVVTPLNVKLVLNVKSAAKC